MPSIQNNIHKVDHLTLFDTFFGSEENHQICYPKDHRTFVLSIILLAILLVLLVIVIIIIVKRNSKIIADKLELIESKNKDLLDSINYAQRIQKAIIPTQEELGGCWENHFVFYQPKDIVSGDFYWTHHTDTEKYIAIIDCTGHGVSGAFMSLLGFNAINNAVKINNITNPTEILHFMNTEIKNILHQSNESELSDGMEIALCVLDKKNLKLKYAGANRPLYLYKDEKLIVINPTKCSVGSIQSHVLEPPTTVTIDINRGDVFYLFTDGIPDQMGGKKGKKFLTAGLKSLISELNQVNFDKQGVAFEKAITDWQGKEIQTDDMLFMGVKI